MEIISQIGIGEFNPKNLPDSKIGKCENSEHEEWQDDEGSPEETLQLVMLYTDEYCDKWLDISKDELSGDEFDALYDKYEKIKWLEGSEEYYCQGCAEMLGEC